MAELAKAADTEEGKTSVPRRHDKSLFVMSSLGWACIAQYVFVLHVIGMTKGSGAMNDLLFVFGNVMAFPAIAGGMFEAVRDKRMPTWLIVNVVLVCAYVIWLYWEFSVVNRTFG